MKVAVPILNSPNHTQSPEMAESFHKCDMLGIYDMETGKLDLFSEHDLLNIYGNVGLVEILKNMEIKAAVCKSYHAMAFNLLCNNDIVPYKAISEKPEENIRMLREKKLRLYQAADNNSLSCSSSCSGCGKGCK